MMSNKSGAMAWLHRRIPTRETLEQSRFVRPFAGHLLRSELWRFTRRSVPRGVALGLFVGVMIPLAHFVVAAFLAVFVRANIPAALAATFIGFPVIYVFIVALAYRIGGWLLHIDGATALQPVSETLQTSQTGELLARLTGAGADTALGLLVIATTVSALGFLASGLLWRQWTAVKRRRRLADARARRAGSIA